jgi:anaerobic sulfite reductase subunit C
MKWEKEAQEVVDAIPVPEIIRNYVVLWAEKLARKKNAKIVGMDEIMQTRDDYYEFLGQEAMEKLQQVRAEGKSDDSIDPMIELNKGPLLYTIDLCHDRFVGCNRALIGVTETGKKVKERLEKLNITQILADKCCDVLMPHSTFTVSICGCANACTGAESHEVGMWGVADPMVTDVKCSQCGSCTKICMDGLIHLQNGKPVIDKNNCVLCGACIKFCPTGTIKAKEKGISITVGGYLGRWKQYGKEIFRLTDESKIFPVVDACVDLIKKEWREDFEDHFSLLTRRCGIDSVQEHARKDSKVKKREGAVKKSAAAKTKTAPKKKAPAKKKAAPKKKKK